MSASPVHQSVNGDVCDASDTNFVGTTSASDLHVSSDIFLERINLHVMPTYLF